MHEVNKAKFSPAAEAVFDYFSGGNESADPKFAEYRERGLVMTNNLGLHVLSFDAGPGSLLYEIYCSNFSDTILEALGRVQRTEPDLWQSVLTLSSECSTLMDKFLEQKQAQNSEADATGALLEDAYWRKAAATSEVFNCLEPLMPEDALSLCK